jgi:hypothetical protein
MSTESTTRDLADLVRGSLWSPARTDWSEILSFYCAGLWQDHARTAAERLAYSRE